MKTSHETSASESPATFGRKRRSDQLGSSSSTTTPKRSTQEIMRAKTPHHIIIVHVVICGGNGAHSEHAESVSYFDHPRLWAGDHKASQLRGKSRIEDLDEYIGQHEELSAIVHREYDCSSYHASVEDLFQRLQLPHQNVTVTSKIRPYLFSLEYDAGLAAFEGERVDILWGSIRKTFESFGCEAPLEAPYTSFYHNREMFTKLQNSAELQLIGLSELVRYIEENYEAEYIDADSLFAAGKVSKRHFAKLFRRQDIVVEKSYHHLQAYECTGISNYRPDSLELLCSSWTFDGEFHRQETSLMVEWPRNTEIMDIHDLSVYPLRLDHKDTKERLTQRGRMFWDFRIRNYVNYNPSISKQDDQSIKMRYMIDMRTYHEIHSQERREPDGPGEVIPITPDNEVPDDSFLIQLPGTVLGFGLHDKKWVNLIVENIEEIQWNSTSFERLVLLPRKKEIIKALVTAHVAKAGSNDIIEGKGNGLIMLLHGSPGTGKTLTAESIAELTHKPLYRVTCGDIGTEPEAIEKYLESVLYVGSTWDCVVLLDEADVFLEERTQNDLQRNALVSVFLRVLEYYDGILILTSNRVGTFDEGFKSRIQLAVHYPRLDRSGRTQIWNGLIRDLEKGGCDANIKGLRDNISLLAHHDLNGRQIRNTVKSAKQLAEYRRERLGYDHFQAVIEVAIEFETYLEEVHGHSERDWASVLGTRAVE